jgi:purine-cytosine permease-like protein
MNARTSWSRILVVVGGVAMLVGAVDPLEGSVVILVGSALVLLGVFLGREPRRVLLYWAAAFLLIALGVAAMFALSATSGIGGTTGYSTWWGALVLPYPVGWIMGMANLLLRLVRGARHRHAAA